MYAGHSRIELQAAHSLLGEDVLQPCAAKLALLIPVANQGGALLQAVCVCVWRWAMWFMPMRCSGRVCDYVCVCAPSMAEVSTARLWMLACCFLVHGLDNYAGKHACRAQTEGVHEGVPWRTENMLHVRGHIAQCFAVT